MTDNPSLSTYPLPPSTEWEFPEIDEFWAGVREHRLLLPRCRGCGRWAWYPMARCVRCFADDFSWEEHDPRGVVYSTTVVRRAFMKGFEALTPLTLVIVELQESGLHFTCHAPRSSTIGAEQIDRAVVVEFEDLDDTMTVPVARLVEG